MANGTLRAYGASVLDRQQIGVALTIVAAQHNTPCTDPLSLDGSNDGVRVSANPVRFDLNADGVAEALPWAAPTDPLLVMDIDGNGRIDNGRELLALTHADAPLNLFSLDDNADKKLDSNDAAFWRLQLWADRNQDGYASSESASRMQIYLAASRADQAIGSLGCNLLKAAA